MNLTQAADSKGGLRLTTFSQVLNICTLLETNQRYNSYNYPNKLPGVSYDL